MQRRMLAVLMVVVGACSAQDFSIDQVIPVERFPPDDMVWGNDWMAGGYHQHDVKLSERVGLSLDWQDAGIAGMSLSYSPSFATRFGSQAVATGVSAEGPLTFRITLRGYELFEANTDGDDSDFLSFDRIRDRDIRKQLVMISVSKHF